MWGWWMGQVGVAWVGCRWWGWAGEGLGYAMHGDSKEARLLVVGVCLCLLFS